MVYGVFKASFLHMPKARATAHTLIFCCFAVVRAKGGISITQTN